MEIVNLNPFDDKDMIDKRNDIAENCFLEIDLAVKSYINRFGKDYYFGNLSILHSTLSYLLLLHTEKEHKLSNINIEKFEMPSDEYKNKKGEVVRKIKDFTDEQVFNFITNLILNSKEGVQELLKSSYFEESYDDSKMFLPKDTLFANLFMQYDKVLLSMNTKYNEVILKFYK